MNPLKTKIQKIVVQRTVWHLAHAKISIDNWQDGLWPKGYQEIAHKLYNNVIWTNVSRLWKTESSGFGGFFFGNLSSYLEIWEFILRANKISYTLKLKQYKYSNWNKQFALGWEI